MNLKHLKNTLEILHDQFGLAENEITPETLIIEDLGADSLDAVELIMAFEELYNIEVPDEEAEKLRRVSDVVDYLDRTIPDGSTQIKWKGKCPEEQEAIDALNKDSIHRPLLQGHVKELENISPLSEAMQDVWNHHVNDTGCFPSCIEISHGDTITGTFSGSRFADEVESILKARGFTISRENEIDMARRPNQSRASDNQPSSKS